MPRGLYKTTDAETALTEASKRIGSSSSNSDSSDDGSNVKKPAKKKKKSQKKTTNSSDDSEEDQSDLESGESSYILQPDRDVYALTLKDIKKSTTTKRDLKTEVSIVGKPRTLPVFPVKYMLIEIMVANKRHAYINPMNQSKTFTARISKNKTKMSTEIKINDRNVQITGKRMPIKFYKPGQEYKDCLSKTCGKQGLSHTFEKYDADDHPLNSKIAIASGTESWLIGISIVCWLPRTDESLFHDSHDDFVENSGLLDVPAKLGKWKTTKSEYDTRMEELTSCWTYNDEWVHKNPDQRHAGRTLTSGFVKMSTKTIITGEFDDLKAWPAAYIIITHPSFSEIKQAGNIETSQGYKLVFEVEDAPDETHFAPQIPGVIIPGEKGKIMSIDEYKSLLESKYWNLSKEERQLTTHLPPVARGSPAEIFAVCTRKSTKEYHKLSAPETVHWKQLSKTSRIILKEAEIEHNRVLQDQLVLCLELRNKSAEDGTLKRLTDEEISAARKKYNVKTDNMLVLANFACYLGILPKILATDTPPHINIEDVQLSADQLQKTDDNGNKPQSCDYCGKVLSSKGALTRHMFSVHEESRTKEDDKDRLRKCSDLLVTYTKPGSTETFKNTCEYAHKDLSRLRRHVRSEHNFELKKCKQKLLDGTKCGEFFTDNYKLLRHQKESAAHCTDKPFKCPNVFCNIGFARKDSRDRHVRNKACKQVSCYYDSKFIYIIRESTL